MSRLSFFCSILLLIYSCRFEKKEVEEITEEIESVISLKYASGFSAYKINQGVILLTINNPWPEASKNLTYALIPRDLGEMPSLDFSNFDGVLSIPVNKLVLTSTTHIPALEALGQIEKLIGFPGLDYISSEITRDRISRGLIAELGANDQLDTERTIALDPDVFIGFGVSGTPRSYQTLRSANIPVIYNGDWMEHNPLGKAEWIKFFGLLLGEQKKADALFSEIETAYLDAKNLSAKANNIPTVLSGALYRDIWYTPGGNSWAAQLLRDAHSTYLWEGTSDTGSLSLSLEAVLQKAASADFWVSPSQFTSYQEMQDANPHYKELNAFKNKKVITYATSLGPTGGYLYFELGPARPDLVLKDLIYYLHPGLLADYEPVFFKPLR